MYVVYSNEYTQHTTILKKIKNDTPKLSLFSLLVWRFD